MNLTTAWLKSYVRYPWDVRRAKSYLENGKTGDKSDESLLSVDTFHRPIVVELHTPQLLFDCGRHLNCIAMHARLAGSPFYLRCSKVLLAGIARKLYGRELLSMPDLTWLSNKDKYPACAMVLTDNIKRCPYPDAIEMRIGRDTVDASPVMPYPMHHRSIESMQHSNLAQIRDTSQRRGVFFAGRIKDSYKRNAVQNQFGVIDRVQAVETLREALSDRVFPTRDAIKTTQTGGVPIVLQDSRLNSIDPSQWLPTLASFDFFLCCPGASQPMCHNAVEAMSVGTIPLLEYANRFTPNLQDGVNAVCFSGREGLLESVHRIDRMSPQEISELRQGVIRYFEEHLRGEQFLAKLRDDEFGSDIDVLSMPFHSSNYFAA